MNNIFKILIFSVFLGLSPLLLAETAAKGDALEPPASGTKDDSVEPPLKTSTKDDVTPIPKTETKNDAVIAPKTAAKNQAVALELSNSVTNSEVALPVPKTTYEDGYFVGIGSHGTLLNGFPGRSLLKPRFGWAIKGGHRWSRWGVFLQVEQDLWLASDFEGNVSQGALNAGVGVEYRYANDFLSTTLAGGPSILLFDTILDDAGQVGFFFDFRPTGLRWKPFSNYDAFVLKLDPLTFTLVVPVLSGIPLIQIEYRTVLSVEFAL